MNIVTLSMCCSVNIYFVNTLYHLLSEIRSHFGKSFNPYKIRNNVLLKSGCIDTSEFSVRHASIKVVNQTRISSLNQKLISLQRVLNFFTIFSKRKYYNIT